MIDRDITVTKLAHKIGITQQNLSRKLNNNDESYTLDYLQNIVNGMGCDIQVNIIDSESQQILYTLTDSE